MSALDLRPVDLVFIFSFCAMVASVLLAVAAKSRWGRTVLFVFAGLSLAVSMGALWEQTKP